MIFLCEERSIVSTNYIPGGSVGIEMNKEGILCVLEENILSNK